MLMIEAKPEMTRPCTTAMMRMVQQLSVLRVCMCVCVCLCVCERMCVRSVAGSRLLLLPLLPLFSLRACISFNHSLACACEGKYTHCHSYHTHADICRVFTAATIPGLRSLPELLSLPGSLCSREACAASRVWV